MYRKTALSILLLAAASSIPLPVQAASTSYNNDCLGDTQPTFSWSDPQGVDYYNQFESGVGGSRSPESSVSGEVTIKCKIDGFNLGDVGAQCGTSDPSDGIPTKCIKFWLFYNVPAAVYEADPSPPTQVTCSDALVSTSSSGRWIAPYTTSAVNFVLRGGVYQAMCEYACIQNLAPCTLGTTVTVRTTGSASFEWEAPDGDLPGDTTTSLFSIGSRNWFNPFTQQTVTGALGSHFHETCQAGHSLLVAAC